MDYASMMDRVVDILLEHDRKEIATALRGLSSAYVGDEREVRYQVRLFMSGMLRDIVLKKPNGQIAIDATNELHYLGNKICEESYEYKG